MWLGPSPAFPKEAVFPNIHASPLVWVGHSGAVQLTFREPFGKRACAWNLRWGVIYHRLSCLGLSSRLLLEALAFQFPHLLLEGKWRLSSSLSSTTSTGPAHGKCLLNSCRTNEDMPQILFHPGTSNVLREKKKLSASVMVQKEGTIYAMGCVFRRLPRGL